jgi:hypothetical protein
VNGGEYRTLNEEKLFTMFMPHQQEIEEYPGVVPRIRRLTVTDDLPSRSTVVKNPVVQEISHVFTRRSISWE